MNRKLLISLLLACALAAAPAAAVAQDAAVKGYGGSGGEVQNVVSGGSADGNGSGTGSGNGTGEVDGSGSLPFTGLDIGLALGGAALLLVAGLALSRVAVRQPQS